MMLWFKVAASEKKRELDVISSYQISGYLYSKENEPILQMKYFLVIGFDEGDILT